MDNKKSYGKFEVWNKTVSELPEDDWSALHWASLLIEQLKGMVELSKSSRTAVLQMVAHAGYCLSYLANDKDDSVRREVAEQGYNLSGFIKDLSYFVREAVAEQGLDVMIEDKSPYVRAEVAKQGYGVDKLSNDNSKIVQRAIKEYEMN